MVGRRDGIGGFDVTASEDFRELVQWTSPSFLDTQWPEFGVKQNAQKSRELETQRVGQDAAPPPLVWRRGQE